VLGVEDANPLWSKPPWIYRYPQCVPAAYRNARYPVLNPWPLRLFLPAERWTRRENGYMRGLLEIAIMRFEKRETRRAMELIDRGLSLDAKSPEFLAAKGMALMESGPAALALEFFDRSIAADPAYDLGLYGRGLIMEVTGNFAAARDAYTRLLAAPPGTLDHKAVKMRLEKLPQ
jgi:tetratricopeptide (TPR) repeat protein